MFPNDYRISNQKYSNKVKKSHQINKDPQKNKAFKYRNEVKEDIEKSNKDAMTEDKTNKSPGGLDLYF